MIDKYLILNFKLNIWQNYFVENKAEDKNYIYILIIIFIYSNYNPI